MYIVGFWNKRNWLTAPLTVGLSLYVSFFLLWSFHICYKVMSSTCYIFSPFFHFQWFSQVVTNFMFTAETYVILLLLKCLSLKATKKSLVKIVEHKLEEAFSDVIRYMRCSFGTLHFTECPNFSTTSQTYLTLLLYYSQLVVETWLHLSLTTFRGFWTIIHSWKLEIIPLQVTSYDAPSMQFSPELSAH